jgi:hypothetical protein
MKMSIREATLNLQKPCTSARIAPWLAVTSCRLFIDVLFDYFKSAMQYSLFFTVKES